MQLTSLNDTTSGRKDDNNKLRYDLIPSYPLGQLAAVYTMGAEKYEDNNWRKGMRWGRVFAAIMRHLWAFWRGEDTDKESGLPHLCHAAWGCFTLLEYSNTKPNLDDRIYERGYPPEPDPEKYPWAHIEWEEIKKEHDRTFRDKMPVWGGSRPSGSYHITEEECRALSGDTAQFPQHDQAIHACVGGQRDTAGVSVLSDIAGRKKAPAY